MARIIDLFPDKFRIDRSSIFSLEGPCWLFGDNINEYGRVVYEGKPWLTHRLSFFLSRGRHIKHHLMVCHKCDRPACCRPSHLFQGNSEANMKDRWKWRAMLPPATVEDTRNFDKRFSDDFLAKRYNLTPKLIKNIRSRKVAA